MILYVVRHAEAAERNKKQPDEWRHLTDLGRKDAAKVAKAIGEYGPKPRRIVTSPLTRAVQTAEIISGYACRKHSVEASMLLLPGGDVTKIVDFLKTCDDAKRVMLVGHEPQLGSLVAILLGQEEGLELNKGACIALKIGSEEKPAQFLWYLSPGKKLVTSMKKVFKLK